MRRPTRGTKVVASAVAAALAATALGFAVAACEGKQPVGATRVGSAPAYSVDGLAAFSCDVSINVNVAIDSVGLRPADAATYTFHITGSNLSGSSPSVTATADQYPGEVFDLLTSPGPVAVPFQSPGPGSPTPPDISAWPLPTQATVDSLKQRPLDSFCNVVRGSNLQMVQGGTLGTGGNLVQVQSYPNFVVDTLTTDAATSLPVEETVALGGQRARDTKYSYATSSDGTFYRSSTSITESFVIQDEAGSVSIQMTTGNVSRTLGGI